MKSNRHLKSYKNFLHCEIALLLPKRTFLFSSFYKFFSLDYLITPFPYIFPNNYSQLILCSIKLFQCQTHSVNKQFYTHSLTHIRLTYAKNMKSAQKKFFFSLKRNKKLNFTRSSFIRILGTKINKEKIVE